MAGPARLTGGDDGGRGPAGREAAGRATIHDVAAAAGVSRQTVTRAMNGMPGISEETKRRVLAAADALAYRPSRFGRGLVTGGDHQLGLVVDDLRNPWSPELAAAVVRIAAARGWNVSLADVGLAADSDRMVEALGAQTDAVIGMLGSRAAEWIGRLGSVPVVELDPRGDPLRAAVQLDPTDAVDALADHLHAAGVRHPVVLDAAVAAGPSARASLLVRAFSARSMDVSVVQASAPTAEAAAAATERIVARPGPPTPSSPSTTCAPSGCSPPAVARAWTCRATCAWSASTASPSGACWRRPSLRSRSTSTSSPATRSTSRWP
ncbi:Catabolite control protein A [Clavibacter michiganensis]|uniref:Catabolite control protein A n=1 Tax=Clavibacter michiganensis TaxID=28447 RepID=A0A251XWJ9_9MICO|nr:Catabolite control protein A [Clavibacter michiganensis]